MIFVYQVVLYTFFLQFSQVYLVKCRAILRSPKSREHNSSLTLILPKQKRFSSNSRLAFHKLASHGDRKIKTKKVNPRTAVVRSWRKEPGKGGREGEGTSAPFGLDSDGSSQN